MNDNEPKAFAHFDGMAWPMQGDRLNELQWRMRYSPESLSRSDMLLAASVLCAYSDLIQCDATKRETVVRLIGSLNPSRQPVP
jgi:hypothetical protein